MKLEWAESESDYGLEDAAFYEAPAALPPAPRKHVSFSLRLELVSITYHTFTTDITITIMTIQYRGEQ